LVQLSGYIDIPDNKSLFFWFFESHSNPSKDPVVIWLNGGPGCSSMFGLIAELGPCKLDHKSNTTYPNPYGWNSNANMLFIDQPSNTGFSKGKAVDNSLQGSKDLYEFLLIFLNQYPSYKNLDLHIFGESYAGKYIPTFGNLILERNELIDNSAGDDSWFKFNLKSIGMGNPFIEPIFQASKSSEFACKNPYNPLSQEECTKMELCLPPAIEALQSCAIRTNGKNCDKESELVDDIIYLPYDSKNISSYDIASTVEQMNLLDDETYFNLKWVKEELGVDDYDHFFSCNDDVEDAFFRSGDYLKSTRREMINILNHKLPVLIYVGDRDFVCHVTGLKYLVADFEWNYQAEFNNQTDMPWISYDNKTSGEYKTYENFTFLKVYEAGHFVPYYEGRSSLLMFNNWITNYSI
jgi:cathepsin A (carboxypeptidase C)